MAISTANNNGYLARPEPSGLADVVELILDKGLVIDVYVRVSLVGIEILTIDARIVVASVDTYLRFAEAVGRLNIEESDQKPGLPDLVDDITSRGARSRTRGVVEAAQEKLSDALGSGDEDEDESYDDEEDYEDEEPEEEREPARTGRSRRGGRGGRR